MRASDMRTALITALLILPATVGCVSEAATSRTRSPATTSASGGAASPDSTGYDDIGILDAVAATSAANAWAVGNNAQTPVIVHWDGRKWSSATAGLPAGTGLDTVAASSPGNAWALGSARLAGSKRGTTPVILHWNGGAWQPVPSPVPPDSFLSSVSVTSPADAWAVGIYFTSPAHLPSSERPIALHWNGSAWQRVPLPRLAMPPGGGAQLTRVSVTSASNAWAVGVFQSSQGNYQAGFVLHWNGSSWRQVPSAPASVGDPVAVAASATRYAWLTAGSVAGLWNGSDWTTVPVPLVGTHFGDRGGQVSALAVSGHVAWLAGDYCATPLACGNGLLLLRWTGVAWQFTPPPANTAVIFGLAVTSPTNAWAVGYTPPATSEEKARMVILHWNGSKWS